MQRALFSLLLITFSALSVGAAASPSLELSASTIDVSQMTAEEALNIGNELAHSRQWELCILAFKRAGELVRPVSASLYFA